MLAKNIEKSKRILENLDKDISLKIILVFNK